MSDISKKFSDREVLKKFKRGAAIDSFYEVEILKKYASTGCVHFGFDYKKDIPTASLTFQGRFVLSMMK